MWCCESICRWLNKPTQRRGLPKSVYLNTFAISLCEVWVKCAHSHRTFFYKYQCVFGKCRMYCFWASTSFIHVAPGVCKVVFCAFEAYNQSGTHNWQWFEHECLQWCQVGQHCTAAPWSALSLYPPPSSPCVPNSHSLLCNQWLLDTETFHTEPASFSSAHQ